MTAFIAFSLLYISFLFWCRIFWMQIPVPKEGKAVNSTFSVILPVREESDNIQDLIFDLARQSYPQEHFEVILVDDSSEDNTLRLAKAAFEETILDYQVIDLSTTGKSGKKQAITAGVALAKNDIILTSDGDCRVQEGWIQAYANKYAEQKLQMVTGPVQMTGGNFFTRLQAVEFSGLIGIGAASLQSGNPTMCNGANLSYRKEVFNAVNGYEGNFEVASGDDEFLLQKVFLEYPGEVAFLKNEKAIVRTPAKPSLRELVNQRLRWSSKWKFHKSTFVKLMALLTFFNYAVLIYSLGLMFFQSEGLTVFLSFMFFRAVALTIFALPISSFFGIRRAPFYAFLIEIIYPFIVLFLGIASIFGHYSWKRRRYS